MARPVAEVLVRFGLRTPIEPMEGALDESPCLPLPGPILADDCALSIELAQEEGNAEGAAEALAAACAEHEAALARERLLFETRLSDERAKWTQDESARLSQKIDLALAEIEADIAHSAARVLRFFLSETLRRKVVEQLAHEVGVLLNDKKHPIIKISGAEDLIDALRDKLSAFSAAIDYAPDRSTDVKVVADQTIIDSRIEAWIERIKALPE